MGGHDPYSSSKGCAELITSAYRRSYFLKIDNPTQGVAVATTRAGNVIGGGDWATDRLVPDIMKAIMEDRSVIIRYPNAIRPWQHVLEPLRGYMTLAEKLVNDGDGYDEGWNFGPDRSDERPVVDVAEALAAALGQGKINLAAQQPELHEANILRLDSSKAHGRLEWRPALDFDKTIEMTAQWYGAWANGAQAKDLCRSQISDYMAISS